MILSIILFGSLIIGLIIKAIFKHYSFKTLLLSLFTICSVIGIFYLHKPTYDIIVPENYIGEVNLILSNVKENRLILDENGIGYINKVTFNKTFNPKIIQNGIEINERTVGFNPSTFWAISKTTTKNGKEIKALTFEIVPKDKIGEKQYYHTELSKFVNDKLITAE
ncbi:hypothetical protein [Formosa sp. PL04]|uniref:hypothetical protein n=1 Tax=Formosa sp. PL04 TaxID=3081755 RepID=UPI002982778C|nr:hypothetical protein [Formosa sp. PL04]MDW5290556.1 hypothetical protein [Formosa sp. PL04]